MVDYAKKINYQNLLLNISKNKLLLLLIVLISSLHALSTIRSSSPSYTHYMSFKNQFDDQITPDIDTIFSSKELVALNLPLNSPAVLILYIKSRNFSKRLSNDKVLREYFFPNNFDKESDTWINSPLKFGSKVKNTFKYILTGIEYESKNVEEVEKFVWAFLNSKLKASYNSRTQIFEFWLNGVSTKFSEYFFTLIIQELNNLYYEKTKITLDSEISVTKIQLELYHGKNIKKYLVNNLQILNFYELMFYNDPPIIFKKVDYSSQRNEPLMGLLAWLIVSILRGFIIRIMLILFKCKFWFSVDREDYLDQIDVNGNQPVKIARTKKNLSHIINRSTKNG